MLDLRLPEVGAERRLNDTSKSEQTHTQTNTHLDISAHRADTLKTTKTKTFKMCLTLELAN